MPRFDAEAEKISAVYAEWEATTLNRQCTSIAQCCHFSLTGKTPYLTRGEAFLAARAWKASGRKSIPAPMNGSCPFLVNARCAIYHHRPFGCRTHFCQAAGGPAPRSMVRHLIQKLEDIDRSLGGYGGVNFPTAVTRAFHELP
jgi:hypothetical protein